MKKLILALVFIVSANTLVLPINRHRDNLLLLAKVLHQKEEKALQTADFSLENLHRYLVFKEVESIDVVLRQACLETGFFTSQSFTNHNNLFGMKVPKVRENLVKYEALGHAGYFHWTESVEDYLLWVKMHENKDKSDYYAFLVETGYCELGGEYISLLKTIKLKI